MANDGQVGACDAQPTRRPNATSPQEPEDQAFIDAISDGPE
jgi:hypothetical protein